MKLVLTRQEADELAKLPSMQEAGSYTHPEPRMWAAPGVPASLLRDQVGAILAESVDKYDGKIVDVEVV